MSVVASERKTADVQPLVLLRLRDTAAEHQRKQRAD
jgi:hypothetical protein